RLLILQNGRIAAQGTLAQLRGQRVLPSLIEVALPPGEGEAAALAAVLAALTPLAGLHIGMVGNCAHIRCLPAQKVEVLRLLLGPACAVQGISIREPSLEDLFLGYGGRHEHAH
ncbi:MAG TPA: copper ABC transporter ATP-binding protein, partial [Janthinobacterium sp.]|nr:copper ABC transporter ATP-binding protein [Janthinobacterium sp.]